MLKRLALFVVALLIPVLAFAPTLARATSLTLTGAGGPSVTAPTAVVVNNSTFADGAATSHAVTLPASIVSGNLLGEAISVNSGTPSITTPAGWSSCYNTVNSDLANAFIYKTATGSEGATVTVTTSSGKVTAIGYQISGWAAIECGTATTGSSTTPDPPSYTASWGAANNLWLAVAGGDARPTTSTFPSGYTNTQQIQTSSGGADFTTSAQRATSAATENPGAFTMSTTSVWVANTIVIEP